MAARRKTEQGMGAVRSSRPPRASGVELTPEGAVEQLGVSCPDPVGKAGEDERPLGTRDTVPAPSGSPSDSNGSGARRRFTVNMLEHRKTIGGIAAPSAPLAPPHSSSPSGPPLSIPSVESSPPASGLLSSKPPGGRYSSQPADEEIILPPPSGNAAGGRKGPRETIRRGERQAIRVDEVGALPKLDATRSAARKAKPRVVDRKRVAGSTLTARDAFVLNLVDGTLSVQEIIDTAGMTEEDVMASLTRLVRFGILALGR
jgi:hypothetical protein